MKHGKLRTLYQIIIAAKIKSKFGCIFANHKQ